MARTAVRLAVVVAAVLATGVAGCLGFKNWEWHQKLTLVVQTPTGIVSGGSVVAVKASTSPKWLPGEGAGGMGSKTIGEASFVELAPGKYLFALLGDETSRVFTTFLPNIVSTEEKAARFETLREIRDVPRARYPLLVTFADIADPKTIQKVDPDNLAASFGPGVSLRRVTLEITGEKVTEGPITSLLPCLKSGKKCVPLNKQLPYGNPMRNTLNDRFWRTR